MRGLSGRRVVITGAGGGIGRVLVAAFAAEEAAVIACDRTLAALDGVPASRCYGFDLTDGDAVAASVERICAEAGPPDVLVNNAGWSQGDTMDRMDAAVWQQEVAINLIGAATITTPILARMKATGGAVVFVASVNALQHYGNPAYAAAKAGLLAYMRAIAVEYGRFGIRANAVCPGTVHTAAWDHRLARDPDIMARVSTFYPLGRLVEPAEVADAVLFLASPAASGITGAALPVDAGLTAGNLGFVRDIMGGG
jgi:NAD(P)-dependent dehydrogenase (short-subunit alcohol dehydrogenase family)